MGATSHDEGDFDAAETFARAELDRVGRDLAEQREPVRAEAGSGGSLAELVAVRDARLWAAIDSGRRVHE